MTAEDDATFAIAGIEALVARIAVLEEILYLVWKAGNDHLATAHPDEPDLAPIGLSDDQNRILGEVIRRAHRKIEP